MRILITAGGTREYIDPVRFISNASSGRMGHELVRAALAAGHEVTLITAPTAQEPPRGPKVVEAETAAEMFKAVKKHFSRCDCLIMTAAVADYTPVRPAASKLKKTGRNLTIRLKPTPDILKWAGAHKKKDQVVIGFALEDKAVRIRAEQKLREKNLDAVVANCPAAIGADKSSVQIKALDSAWIKIENAAKSATASKIISLTEKLHGAKLRNSPRC
jgi:phosphopantothenoylcysteine decarboxylase/phosphopantothenate--cysteine ligase